jgi:hypothetical protein
MVSNVRGPILRSYLQDTIGVKIAQAFHILIEAL